MHAVVHRVPLQWADTEEKAYQALKVMLSQAPVVQPPDWTKSFHVFVDASDVAIDSVLMQLTTELATDAMVADKDKWLTEMHQFLSTGIPPENMDHDERKRVAVRSRHFCLVGDTLYHKGADGI